MSTIGVILARGGSRRLPRKNVLELAGKPLIAYTIEAARQARSLSQTIVSTDDPEIVRIADQYGGSAPFLRPGHLALDTTPSIAALEHAVQWLEERGALVETVVLLQPTSPLRRSEHIDSAVALFDAENADSVISVTHAPVHPYWCWRESAGRLVPYFTKKELATERASLPEALVANGAVYVVRRDLLRSGSLYGDRVIGYLMSERDSLDIDTTDDFASAEGILRANPPEVGL